MTYPPPGWYPDPWWPGRPRWWDGTSWTDHVGPPAAPASVESGLASDAVRAGLAGSTTRWLSWVAIGHLTVVPLLVAYLAIVAANSWVYDYNAWSEPPPSNAADYFAVVSFLVIAVVIAVLGVVGYGWMCRQALGDTSLSAGLGGVIRPAVRASWYAAPLLLFTVLSILLVVPGVVAVALVGVVPLLSIAPDRPPDGYWGLVSRGFGPLALVGVVGAVLGMLLWVTVVITSLLAGVFPPLAWLVGWATFCLAAVIVGGAATAFAHVYRALAHP